MPHHPFTTLTKQISHLRRKCAKTINSLASPLKIAQVKRVYSFLFAIIVITLTIRYVFIRMNGKDDTILEMNTVNNSSPTFDIISQLHTRYGIEQNMYYRLKRESKLRKIVATVPKTLDVSHLEANKTTSLSVTDYLNIQKTVGILPNSKTPLIHSDSSQESTSQHKPIAANVFLIAVVGLEFEEDLFPYYIKFYEEKVGIPTTNMRLIFQSADENKQLLNRFLSFCNEHKVPVVNYWVGVFESFKKRDLLNEVIDKTIPQENAWIMHTDVDEFHDYTSTILDNDMDKRRQSIIPGEKPLYKFIRYLDRNGYDYAMGDLQDRVANDCSFHDAQPFVNKRYSYLTIFEQFPCTVAVTKNLVGGMTQKLVLYRSHLRAFWGGHHLIEYSKRYSPKLYPHRLRIDHFKWRNLVIQKIENRLSTFRKQTNLYSWWTESAKFLKHVKRNGYKLAIRGCPCTPANRQVNKN